MNTYKNQDKGFTLVELLIVIVILGILATVTVFAVNGITSNAQTNACSVEEKNIATASAAFAAENNGNQPTQATDVTPYGVEQATLDKFTITWGDASTPPVLATGPTSNADACTV